MARAHPAAPLPPASRLLPRDPQGIANESLLSQTGGRGTATGDTGEAVPERGPLQTSSPPGAQRLTKLFPRN